MVGVCQQQSCFLLFLNLCPFALLPLCLHHSELASQINEQTTLLSGKCLLGTKKHFVSALDIDLMKPVTNVEGQFEWHGLNEDDCDGHS